VNDRGRGHDVGDRIPFTQLVKAHGVGGCAMHPSLGLREEAEDGKSVVPHSWIQGSGAKSRSDLRKGAVAVVVVRGMLVRVAVIVSRSTDYVRDAGEKFSVTKAKAGVQIGTRGARIGAFLNEFLSRVRVSVGVRGRVRMSVRMAVRLENQEPLSGQGVIGVGDEITPEAVRKAGGSHGS